jgi:hypothetical protein
MRRVIMQRNVRFATSFALRMIVMKQKVTITRTGGSHDSGHVERVRVEQKLHLVLDLQMLKQG